MVSNLENAKRALRQKLANEKDYHPILTAYDAFFELDSDISKTSEDSESHLHHSHKKNIQSIEKTYVEQSEKLFKRSEGDDKYIESTKTTTDSQLKASLLLLEQKLNENKSKLETQASQDDTSYQAKLKTEQHELSKAEAQIQKAIDETKKKYLDHVKTIESSYIQEKSVIEQDYNNKKQALKEDLDVLISTYEKEHQVLIETREKEKTAHDHDYISIKKHYNLLNQHINTQINDLKKYQQEITSSIDDYFSDKEKPLIEAKDNIKKIRTNTENKAKQALKDTLSSILKEKSKLEVNYEQNKKKIIAQTAEAVSTLNSKLSNFREITNVKKRQIIRDFHKNRQTSNREDVSKKNGELNKLDKELNLLILKTKRIIKDKKIEGQLLLFEHEKAYHKSLSKLNYEKKHAYTIKDLAHKKAILIESQQQRHIEDKISRLYLEKQALIDELVIHVTLEMNKIETQVAIASETQERDLSQLTQDAYIDLSDIEKDIYTHTFHFDTNRIELEAQLKLLAFQEESDIELITIHQKRALERESIIRDLELDEQYLRRTLAKNMYLRKLSSLDLEMQKNNAKNETSFIQLEDTYNYDVEILKLDTHFHDIESSYNHLKEDLLSSYELRMIEFHRIESLMKETLTYHGDTIKHQFFQLYQQESATIKLRNLLEKLYKTPAHMDALRLYFNFYEEMLKTFLIQATEHLIVTKNNVIERYQSYVKDLIESIQNIRLQDFELEKAHYIETINLKKTSLEKKKYDLQIEIKKLSSTNKSKDIEKNYQHTLRQLELVEKEYDKANQLDHNKRKAYEKSIKKVHRKHQKYVHLLEQGFMSTEHAITQFYEQQLHFINELKKVLYMSDATISSGIKHSERLCKQFSSKLIFNQQLIYNTLTYHYDLLKTHIEEEKDIKSLHQSNDLTALIEQQQAKISHIEQEKAHLRRQYRKHVVALKNDLESTYKTLEIKAQQAFQKLSKTISDDEALLQTFKAKKSESLAYHDMNSESLKTQHLSRTKAKIHTLHTQKVSQLTHVSDVLKSQDQQLLADLSATEQRIENRLIQYRAFVSKKRESIIAKSVLYEQNIVKHHDVYKRKRQYAKRKTKHLLQAIQKEKRRFTTMHHRSERRLLKTYYKKDHDMQKLILRAYKFKRRMLQLS